MKFLSNKINILSLCASMLNHHIRDIIYIKLFKEYLRLFRQPKIIVKIGSKILVCIGSRASVTFL